MSKQKHILVISQYFYPEQFRINDICTEWIKRGYKVTVITGIPNYPQGKYYNGYNLTHKRNEKWNGINIVRIPLIPRGNNSIGMICNYFSFVLSGFIWNLFTDIEADYVFNFEVSPMTQALVGVWYAKKRKIPCYLYVQDLWPENIEIVTGIRCPLILKPISKMVNYIYSKCTHIFATSPSFVEEIQNRCDKKNKVSYWPQYAEDFYKPMEREIIPEIPNDSSFKIIFTGNIGQAQGLDVLPKTAKLLKEENIKFIIVGDGRNRENFLKQLQRDCIEHMFVMIEKQPAERIPKLLACCDAAFISFMDNKLFTKTIPAKLQSYMACGMPIIASAAGETEQIINKAKCGVCGQIGNAEQLYEKIMIISKKNKDDLEKMKNNSFDFYQKNYCKKDLMDEIDNYFTDEN